MIVFLLFAKSESCWTQGYKNYSGDLSILTILGNSISPEISCNYIINEESFFFFFPDRTL